MSSSDDPVAAGANAESKDRELIERFRALKKRVDDRMRDLVGRDAVAAHVAKHFDCVLPRDVVVDLGTGGGASAEDDDAARAASPSSPAARPGTVSGTDAVARELQLLQLHNRALRERVRAVHARVQRGRSYLGPTEADRRIATDCDPRRDPNSGDDAALRLAADPVLNADQTRVLQALFGAECSAREARLATSIAALQLDAVQRHSLKIEQDDDDATASSSGAQRGVARSAECQTGSSFLRATAHLRDAMAKAATRPDREFPTTFNFGIPERKIVVRAVLLGKHASWQRCRLHLSREAGLVLECHQSFEEGGKNKGPRTQPGVVYKHPTATPMWDPIRIPVKDIRRLAFGVEHEQFRAAARAFPSLPPGTERPPDRSAVTQDPDFDASDPTVWFRDYAFRDDIAGRYYCSLTLTSVQERDRPRATGGNPVFEERNFPLVFETAADYNAFVTQVPTLARYCATGFAAQMRVDAVSLHEAQLTPTEGALCQMHHVPPSVLGTVKDRLLSPFARSITCADDLLVLGDMDSWRWRRVFDLLARQGVVRLHTLCAVNHAAAQAVM